MNINQNKNNNFWADLYACGHHGMPAHIQCLNKNYSLAKTFKHDFFAATGLYQIDESDPASDTHRRIVLKINRIQSFFGMPLSWMGRWLCRRETFILRRLNDIDNIPKVIDTWRNCGFIYPYIEGQSLDMKPAVPDDYFDNLADLIQRIHQKDVIYLDFNKRGNILLTDDGKPSVIDFQISLYLPSQGFLSWFYNFLHRILQNEDRYHLLKHKKALRPDLMDENQLHKVRKKSILIHIHRILTWPYKKIRRWFMKLLYRHKFMNMQIEVDSSPENDPHRYAKR